MRSGNVRFYFICFLLCLLLGVNVCSKEVFNGVTVDEKDKSFDVSGKYFSFELLKNGALKKVAIGEPGKLNFIVLNDLQLRIWAYPGWGESYQDVRAKVSKHDKKKIPDGVEFSFNGTMTAIRDNRSEVVLGTFDYDEKVTVRNNGRVEVVMKIRSQTDTKLNRIALVPKLNYDTYKGEMYDAVIKEQSVAKKFPDDNKNGWVVDGGVTEMLLYHSLLPFPPARITFPTTDSQIEKWSLKFDIFNLAKYKYPDIVKGQEHVLQANLTLTNKPVTPKKSKRKIKVDLDKKIRKINKELFGLNVHQPHVDLFKDMKARKVLGFTLLCE